MEFRVKHRKLFYVPGMISLVLIPVLCLWHFYSQRSFEVERAMDLGLPDKASKSEFIENYLLFTKRNFKEFTFNGTLEDGKNDLIRFQKSLKQQNKINDTVNGLRLHFGEQMKYEVFIRVLDILTIEDTPTYIPYDSELFVVNGSRSDIERETKRLGGSGTRMNCGTQAYMESQRVFDEEQKKLIDNENFQNAFFKDHWYLFLIYFGIGLINLYMLIKFNKNRIYNQKSYI